MVQFSAEGVNPATLPPGSSIDVETKSRHYRIECLGGREIRISGHPDYCLTPVPAYLHGSINNEGVVVSDLIERGRKVMFSLNGDRPVTTSRVVSVHVNQPEVGQAESIH
jgi:hypothetical protein